MDRILGPGVEGMSQWAHTMMRYAPLFASMFALSPRSYEWDFRPPLR
jgi:hypothetical protein